MADIAKVGTPSLSDMLPPPNDRLSELFAGEAFAAGDLGYVKSDGKAWLTVGSALATPAIPAVGTAASGGTVLAGTYLVQVAYINASGQVGLPSPAVPITTTGAESTITVTSPSASTGATKYAVYISAAGGGATYLQNTTGTALATDFTLTAPPVTNTANPGSANGSAGAASMYDGVALAAASANQGITLGHGVTMRYGSGLTPGVRYYPSATAGALADTPAYPGQLPVAKAINATEIYFFHPNR